MRDLEFTKMLRLLLLKQSGFRLPRPVRTEQDQAYYLEYAGRFLCPGYQPDWPQKAWYTSPEIEEFVRRFPEEWRGFNLDRHYNLLQLLKLAENVAGDTAECGVFRGASSWLIMRHLPNRIHHVFDSFEGISEPEEDDGKHWHKGALACPENEVKANLGEFDGRCVLHKGWIPQRFRDVEDKKFAFVHIDVDLAQPTRDSLEFFYPCLSPGAILVCDDYGFTTCPGATKAFDDFLADKPEKMIAMASGGGWLMKSPQGESNEP